MHGRPLGATYISFENNNVPFTLSDSISAPKPDGLCYVVHFVLLHGMLVLRKDLGACSTCSSTKQKESADLAVGQERSGELDCVILDFLQAND